MHIAHSGIMVEVCLGEVEQLNFFQTSAIIQAEDDLLRSKICHFKST
mgnify:CR=1 FL=1